MKNKFLALSAAILLAGGIAFGFAQSNNGACCNVEASTCCDMPCPSPDQCPIPCCDDDDAAAGK